MVQVADLLTEKASIETALEHRDRQLAEVKVQLTAVQSAYDSQKQQVQSLARHRDQLQEGHSSLLLATCRGASPWSLQDSGACYSSARICKAHDASANANLMLGLSPAH